MTKDKITDEYIKAVQKQFKHYHTTDARFISDLKDAVISYAAQQDSLDYEQLVSQFGDPQELVNDYFSVCKKCCVCKDLHIVQQA